MTDERRDPVIPGEDDPVLLIAFAALASAWGVYLLRIDAYGALVVGVLWFIFVRAVARRWLA